MKKINKKRNVHSVLLNTMIKKPRREKVHPSFFKTMNIKQTEQSPNKNLALEFDMSELNENSSKENKQLKINNNKKDLNDKLQSLKEEYKTALETKKSLESDIKEAKVKANNSFFASEGNAELQNYLNKSQKRLENLLEKYNEDIKNLERMKNMLDEYRTDRFGVVNARKMMERKTQSPTEIPKNLSFNQNLNNSFYKNLKKPTNIKQEDDATIHLFQQIDDYIQKYQQILDLTNSKNILHVFGQAEKIETENKKLTHFLETNQPRLEEWILRRDELKKQYEEIKQLKDKEFEEQNEELGKLGTEIEEVMNHLASIEDQKRLDHESFFHVFLEIADLFKVLECNPEDIKVNDQNLQNQSNEMIKAEHDEEEQEANECIINHENVLIALAEIEDAIANIDNI